MGCFILCCEGGFEILDALWCVVCPEGEGEGFGRGTGGIGLVDSRGMGRLWVVR